jgi:hypothetical protein
MSSITSIKIQEALALGEENKQNPEGYLQGRKVHPIGYYLLLAGCVLGSIGVVALTIAAIVTAIFTLYIFAGALLLVAMANALAAYIIHRLSPEEGLDNLIDELCIKVKKLYQKVQELFQDPKNEEVSGLKAKLEIHKELFDSMRNAFAECEQEQTERDALKNNIVGMNNYLKEKNIDVVNVKELQKSVTKVTLKPDFENIAEYIKQVCENNIDFYKQISAVVLAAESRCKDLDTRLSDLTKDLTSQSFIDSIKIKPTS